MRPPQPAQSDEFMMIVFMLLILLVALDFFYTAPAWVGSAIFLLTTIVTADLAIKFYFAQSKALFIRSNLLEIISLLPFLEELRLFRLEWPIAVKTIRPIINILHGFSQLLGSR